MEYLSQFFAFNRGLVSSLALARIDLKKLALSASVFVNWMPRVLGAMMARPGTGYLSSTLNDAYSAHIDFQFGTSDTALLECTTGALRVRIADQIITRPGVTSTFYHWNGSAYVTSADQSTTFADSTAVGYWHNNDQAGALSSLYPGGGLAMLGAPGGTAQAVRDTKVAVAGLNIGVEHEITIVVARGEVVVRIGTSEGDDTYLGSRVLRVGTHSLAITPSGDFFLRLSSYLLFSSVVRSVALRAMQGDMVLPTAWTTNLQLDELRWSQSVDVIFVGCSRVQPQRIERQDRINTPPSRSWSICEYAPNDGPFGDINTGPITLAANALTGDVGITASGPFWKSTHVGAFFRLTSASQTVVALFTGQAVFSDPIKVTGVGGSRAFNFVLAADPTYVSSVVTLQFSLGTLGNWEDQASYSAAGNYPFQDYLDNQIVYYRLGIKTGNYTSGDSIQATMFFGNGSIEGVIRITAVNSNLSADASVVKALGGTDPVQNWEEGDWSAKNGFPDAPTLFGGRLHWAGQSLWWGSVSGLYDSFSDDTTLGDAATIRGDLGSGPVDNVNWLLALNNLMIGADGEAMVAQASTITGPLTPTDKGLKTSTDVGTAPIRAVKVDTVGIFVARNGSRVYQLSADANLYTLVPYIPADLTALVPELGVPAFKRMAVQRAKDTRIHAVRSDGQVAIMVFDKNEEVKCWLLFEAGGGGIVEDVIVLPGTLAAPLEDQVYYVVNRTVNGSPKRFLEKWALESQGVGAADTRLLDCHIVGTGTGGTTIVVPHLEGATVMLWGNGKDLGSYVVSGGAINASEPVTGTYTVGLPYTAQWQSTKLAVGSRMQAPLNQYKNVDHIGFVLQQTHAQGLLFGTDFDHLDPMPAVEDGAVVDPNSIWATYDKIGIPVDGTWSTDARICLQSVPNRPCTVLGVTIGGDGNDKT